MAKSRIHWENWGVVYLFGWVLSKLLIVGILWLQSQERRFKNRFKHIPVGLSPAVPGLRHF